MVRDNSTDKVIHYRYDKGIRGRGQGWVDKAADRVGVPSGGGKETMILSAGS